MTQPRFIVPGATYLLTRRVLLRHMLLRPDADITNLLTYALGFAAERFGIQVHAFCVMSTHHHIVATDPRGVLPRFLHCFHRIVALGTKALRNWEGPVWDQELTSAVRLTTHEAVIDKIAYTLVNPVAAGLVRRAHEWPGAKVLVEQLGNGVLQATRPLVYFDPDNPAWPEAVTLRIEPPPAVESERVEAFRETVALEVERREASAFAEMPEAAVVGVAGLLDVSPHERAVSREPELARNPTFAAGRRNGQGYKRAAEAVRAFRVAYRAALERWRAGVRSVLFPVGTWWMRVLHAVDVVEICPVV